MMDFIGQTLGAFMLGLVPAILLIGILIAAVPAIAMLCLVGEKLFPRRRVVAKLEMQPETLVVEDAHTLILAKVPVVTQPSR